jgi:hypothetical protein
VWLGNRLDIRYLPTGKQDDPGNQRACREHSPDCQWKTPIRIIVSRKKDRCGEERRKQRAGEESPGINPSGKPHRARQQPPAESRQGRLGDPNAGAKKHGEHQQGGEGRRDRPHSSGDGYHRESKSDSQACAPAIGETPSRNRAEAHQEWRQRHEKAGVGFGQVEIVSDARHQRTNADEPGAQVGSHEEHQDERNWDASRVGRRCG